MKKNPHTQHKISESNRSVGRSMRRIKLFENFDTVDDVEIEETDEEVSEDISDDDMEAVKEIIRKHSFFDLGDPLKKLGFKVDFSTEPITMYQITKGGKKLAILNKRYVEDADFVHDEIAMGIMESMQIDRLNEVDVKAVAGRTLRVKKKFIKKVEDMVTLAKEFEEMKKQYTAMGKLLGKHEQEVQDELEAYGAQFIRVGKIAISLKNVAGRKSASYQNIAEDLEKLLPVTKEMEEAIKNIRDAHSKINPDKIKMEYSVDENIKDAAMGIAKKIGGWFTTLFDKISAHLPKFEKSVDDLAKQFGITVPSTEEAVKMMEKA